MRQLLLVKENPRRVCEIVKNSTAGSFSSREKRRRAETRSEREGDSSSDSGLIQGKENEKGNVNRRRDAPERRGECVETIFEV